MGGDGKEKFPQPLTELFPAGTEMDRTKFMRDVRRWKSNLNP
ncbi:MAG: hypothetical protein CM1200mP16_03660 [Nitrospina sp.]|nr:MAG: hypothetical protein CM1200mP16_03660 [Nitrospina sp.]